jgi:hypothetical protein
MQCSFEQVGQFSKIRNLRVGLPEDLACALVSAELLIQKVCLIARVQI